MAANTFDSIMSALKRGEYAPIYFLQGDESYFIDQIVDYISKNALSESEQVFNQLVCYGRDSNSRMIIDNARQYPMMAQRRVIILKEAQSMSDLKDLKSYVTHPAESTVLVIAHPHKKLDGRKALGKAISKNAVVFESKRLYENQIAPWIENYVKSKKFEIEHEASKILPEYLGNDLSKIINEVEKLFITLNGRKRITEDDVFQNIGISKEYNQFELVKALSSRDTMKLNRIVMNMASNMKSHPLVLIISAFYAHFTKVLIVRSMGNADERALMAAVQVRYPMHFTEYKVAARNFTVAQLEQIIAIIKKFDLQSKGLGKGSKPDAEVLRELVQEIYTIPQRMR